MTVKNRGHIPCHFFEEFASVSYPLESVEIESRRSGHKIEF